jgi:cellulose synthase (UDP-forming)
MKPKTLFPFFNEDPKSQSLSIGWILLGFASLLMYLLKVSIDVFDLQRQLMLSWGVFVILACMYKWQVTKRPPWRFLFILLSGFLALRYLIWRSTETLIYTGPLDFIAMTLLYLAEVYSLTIYMLGILLNLWPLRNRPLKLPPNLADYPVVDVFIPTYDESDDIIRITTIAASQIDYPKDKLRIHICDDGSTINKRNNPASAEVAWARYYRLRRLAQELGANYITRETNVAAKAGNLNHALHQTHGELFLVLDCDHVPTHDILRRTVGFFSADPKLFLVQTPHFFINPTPVEKNLIGVGNPNRENDMFYKEIHRSLDFWNSSYFCGSAALLRRRYVMEVGGIAGKTITEDAETSFHLHSLGYNSIYLDRPMVCGLSPESYKDYILQRTRWAQGMVQLFLLSNPLMAKGLSFHQRLCYFNFCFYWFFGLARVMFFIAPALFLLLSLKIYFASFTQVISYAVPYIFSTFMLMDFFYGRARQPFFSEIYESVQSIFLAPAVMAVLFNPHKPSFKVTPKGNTQEQDFLNPLAAIFFVIILVNILAIGAGVISWFTDPILRDTLSVTAVWCTYNVVLAIISLGAFWERKQLRQFHRINVEEPMSIRLPDGDAEYMGETMDLSITGLGFKVKLPKAPKVSEPVILETTSSDGRKFIFNAVFKRVIEQNGTFYCGTEFVLDKQSYAQAVAYLYGDSGRWTRFWAKKTRNEKTFRMLGHLFVSGIKGMAESMGIMATSGVQYLLAVQRKYAKK